jgi:hypothetical protein
MGNSQSTDGTYFSNSTQENLDKLNIERKKDNDCFNMMSNQSINLFLNGREENSSLKIGIGSVGFVSSAIGKSDQSLFYNTVETKVKEGSSFKEAMRDAYDIHHSDINNIP